MIHGGTGRWARRLLVPVLALGLVAAACSGDGDEGATPTTGPVTIPDEVALEGEIELTLEAPERCEHLGAGGCLLPFPSDHFTRPDDTPTGLRLDLAAESMPANTSGAPVDPAEWNRSDGFSPGSLIVLVVPDVDLAASGAPTVTDIGRSTEDDSPVVLLDAETGERVPVWAELDQGQVAEEPAPTLGPEERALLLRPARNLAEGHRHVVALRDLVDGNGLAIEPSDGFRAYRDRLGTGIEAVEERRPRMERLFGELEQAGVARDELFLAWDFTVASQEGLSGRLLAMRDDAFASLGEAAPAFTVASAENAGVARVVQGTFEVPSYLTDGGAPGSVLANEGDPDGIPSRAGTLTAEFLCVAPADPLAVTGDSAGGAIVYGHGLLGSRNEVRGLGTIAAGEAGATACATDWIGMSSADIGPIAGMIGDFSAFRMIPDRLQQAHLNMLFLGRLLAHPDGFAADPAFQGRNGEPVFEVGRVGYLGASQGGILGGATTAVALDWERAVLAVPAQNYSTLLDRSIDFDEFDLLFAAAYPSALDRQLVLSLIQVLWDRGENNGYSQHLTGDPLPGTADDKQVLIVAAFGDHQVANIGTDSLARTAGIPLRVPGLADGRSSDDEPFWGLEAIGSWPHRGSAYLLWDFGTPTPPVPNLPPREGDDPHSKPGLVPEARAAIIGFLATGQIDDPCPEAEPCQAEV